MWSLDACMLCFFLLLALFNPAAGNAAPVTSGGAGFSLPIVSSHRSTADGLGYLQVVSNQDHGADDRLEDLLLPASGGAANLTRIRPKIAPVAWPVFSVVVGVGTGHHRHFYKLALDLVGGLTWMQCEPCVPELRQEGTIFDSSLSPRYKHVLPTDHECQPPYARSGHDRCSFDVRFTAATAHGYLGKDVFTFAGTTDSGNSVDSLTFGCAHTTHAFTNHGVLAGVISLNKHSTSFVRQLATHGVGVTHLRFSYCLFYDRSHATTTRHGFLRFGSDVPNQHRRTQSTPLFYGGVLDEYHISIVGVSINGGRIKTITAPMFKRDHHMGRGGTIVDAGTPLTRMVQAAYVHLEAAVAAHMHGHGAHHAAVPGHRLCYRATSPEIHAHVPSMTLHMSWMHDTKLVIKSHLLFMSVAHEQRQHLCLAVVPDEEMTVVGAAQQVDTRFTFDLDNHLLFFAPEQCHDDAS